MLRGLVVFAQRVLDLQNLNRALHLPLFGGTRVELESVQGKKVG